MEKRRKNRRKNSIKTKNLIQITHIIPIIEPKPPLYNEE